MQSKSISTPKKLSVPKTRSQIKEEGHSLRSSDAKRKRAGIYSISKTREISPKKSKFKASEERSKGKEVWPKKEEFSDPSEENNSNKKGVRLGKVKENDPSANQGRKLVLSSKKLVLMPIPPSNEKKPKRKLTKTKSHISQDEVEVKDESDYNGNENFSAIKLENKSLESKRGRKKSKGKSLIKRLKTRSQTKDSIQKRNIGNDIKQEEGEVEGNLPQTREIETRKSRNNPNTMNEKPQSPQNKTVPNKKDEEKIQKKLLKKTLSTKTSEYNAPESLMAEQKQTQTPKFSKFEEEFPKEQEINQTSSNKEKRKILRPKQTKHEKEGHLKKYSEAIEKLQEYALPDLIPCREDEKKVISQFLIEGLQNQGSNQTLYISGIPGIGKTVTFLEVVRNLKEIPGNEFLFININGMSLKDPENVYLILLQEITGIKNVSRSTACIILNELFRQNKVPRHYQKESKINPLPRIILLDELDYFLTKDQTILYNLFEWPHCKYAKMIMTGIANTVDFPERLQPKIASRIGNQRLTYKPYTSPQIQTIVEERMKKIEGVFEPQSLIFVSKKLATFSSDIRRTLNVCRKAVEICQEEARNQGEGKEFKVVTIDHIKASYNQLYSTPYIECLKNLSEIQKILLTCLALETRSQIIGRISFYRIYDRFKTMMGNMGKSPILKITETLKIFYQMMSINLLVLKERNLLKNAKAKSKDPNLKDFDNLRDYDVNICISLDDITNALKDDPLFQEIFLDKYDSHGL